VVPAAPAPRRALAYGWRFVPVLTVGILAFLPVVIGVAKLGKARTARDTWAVALMVLGTIVTFMIFGSSDSSPDAPITVAENIGAVIAIALMVGGTIETVRLHRTGITAVATPSLPAPPAPRASAQLGAATAAEERRRESRRILAEDPIAAVRLQIGRPDLPGRVWDDGGLVNVNFVDAVTLSRHLRLTPTQAESIVNGRALLGGKFTNVYELGAYIDPDTFERIDDYVVL
jgi:hypothetical protein